MPDSLPTAYRVRIADQDVAIEIASRRPELRLQIDGQAHVVMEHSANTHPTPGRPVAVHPSSGSPASGHPSNSGPFALTLDGTTYHGWRYASGNEVHIRLGARTFVVSRANAGSSADRMTNPQHELRADMPGVVVAVHCEVGQTVASGDPLLTIESMKLQATLLASHPAVVERVHTGIETAFERGALLVSFAKPNAAP